MNWDQVKGRWRQLSGSAKAQWGKLTDDELMRIDGDRERLTGLIQTKYGIALEEAERQADEWLRRQ